MTSSDDKIPTNAAQNSLIEMQSVCLDIEGNRVLKNVSFATKSRRLGIIGRNGSGKSTLSRVLSGLIEIQSGKLEVAGIDPYNNRGAAVAQIGILFQNPDHQIIFPTVIEELVFGLRQQGQSKAESKSNALNILAKFGKTHWQDVHTASLSQGQKHLVCLMSIVAMQPKLIILDEPFAGLDIPTKRQLQRYLDSFDGCLVHISHDPADIEHYDQILWLESGQIEEVGTPDAVLPNYLAEMNRLGDSDDISNLTN